MASDRVIHLDGLRGLAIVLVVVGHYIGLTYSSHFPYGDSLSWIPVFKYGGVGVQLFFLISGFVIFMSLERSENFSQFIARRWLRLFPAMAIATTIIFIMSIFLANYLPHGRAELVDLLPGISFISPSFWHVLLQVPIRSLDNVFWTIYVEVGFYIAFSIMYFLFGGRGALIGLLILWLFGAWVGIGSASGVTGGGDQKMFGRIFEPVEWLGVRYYGWFASGALFFKAYVKKSQDTFKLAILIGVIAAFTQVSTVPVDGMGRFMLLLCVFMFAAAQKFALVQRILEFRVPYFIGIVSYPLYLIHCELGIGLIALSGNFLSSELALLMPLVMTTIMIAIAWIIVRYIEPHLSEMLRNALEYFNVLPGRGK